MRRETKIAITAAEVIGSKYDEVCKELFQNKEIIAPVLKETVPEYRNSTVEEVIGYIDADSIRDIPVDDVSVSIGGLSTELGSVSDKLIRYDTHFKAVNPILSNENLSIHLHIDLEVQNDYRPDSPSYPIVKRGIYYVAREISSQLGILTERTDYGALQKSYSIWICNERIPARLQNTVSMYSIKKADLIGRTDEPEEDFDLMTVILIRRGVETDIPIFEYLSGIFDCDKHKIAKYVDIEGSEPVRKGVNAMSGLGQAMMDKWMQKGLEQGLQQGMRQGLQQGMKQGLQQGMKQGLQQGIQQGIQQGMEEGLEKGLEKGWQQGETLLATLVGYLRRDGRLHDLDSIADEEARRRLYREYNLVD